MDNDERTSRAVVAITVVMVVLGFGWLSEVRVRNVERAACNFKLDSAAFDVDVTERALRLAAPSAAVRGLAWAQAFTNKLREMSPPDASVRDELPKAKGGSR